MMTITTTLRVPSKKSAAYEIGALLAETGPLPVVEVFARVYCGTRPQYKYEKIDIGIEAGWIELHGDIVSATAFCKRKLSGVTPPPEPTEYNVALPRVHPHIFSVPPLSIKFMPNPHGTRADIPEWSHRDAHFFISGTQAEPQVRGVVL